MRRAGPRKAPVAAPSVLVVDVEGRAGLATVRGLWQGGYSVTGAASTRLAAGHWSRGCDQRLFVANPYVRPEAFVDDVAQAVDRGRYAALVANTDIALQLISRNRSLLPPPLVDGLPDSEAVERSLEKGTLVELAGRFELASPPSVSCANADEAVAAAVDLGFPAVIKPARSVADDGAGLVRRAAVLVRDAAAAHAVASDCGEHVIVQRFEPTARVLATGGVLTPKGLHSIVVARWLRTWPPLAGATSFCETVTAPPGLLERVEALLRTIGHVGIFELELLERRDGTYAALDLNPRPFGWMTLAVRSGANLPAIWCDWVLGREPVRASARPGVRYRWEDADLKHLVWQLRRGHVRAAAAVLRPRTRVAHAYFELADPSPLAAALVRLVRQQVRRARRRT